MGQGEATAPYGDCLHAPFRELVEVSHLVPADLVIPRFGHNTPNLTRSAALVLRGIYAPGSNRIRDNGHQALPVSVQGGTASPKTGRSDGNSGPQVARNRAGSSRFSITWAMKRRPTPPSITRWS